MRRRIRVNSVDNVHDNSTLGNVESRSVLLCELCCAGRNAGGVRVRYHHRTYLDSAGPGPHRQGTDSDDTDASAVGVLFNSSKSITDANVIPYLRIIFDLVMRLVEMTS